jgi:hypothetical protein
MVNSVVKLRNVNIGGKNYFVFFQVLLVILTGGEDPGVFHSVFTAIILSFILWLSD